MGKTHVTSWIPAVESEQSRCTVHYNMCASHLGGALTVISSGAEAVFPPAQPLVWRHPGGRRVQLDAGATFCWTHVQLPASGVLLESDLCAVSVSGPQRERARQHATRKDACAGPTQQKCAAESQPAASVADSS